ncbi:hypothetical protein MKK68_16630 [Methylobacterium sp. E-016]|uniref:hypothetical protein n=1 Tax=Methylobacterium sp. E-016 TaxID=2836556 RepID=UPI001FB97CB7|nr:hypothetical protein [Methylobacterium sp. E-016]MCJ2077253.1 hypothetical protein [Methylobacterium sp. E-016]
MDAPDRPWAMARVAVSAHRVAAAADELLASHYANLAAYMDQQASCAAGELFRTLSRHHAIRALAKRGEAAALAQKNGLLWED